MIIKKNAISEKEYRPYFKRYFDLTPEGVDLITGLKASKKELLDFFRNDVPKDRLEYRYAAEKWTVKEVLQHIIDTERIFMYRCFRAGRQDLTDMMGFEQDDYIIPSGANDKSLEALLLEYEITRDAYINLVESFSASNLAFVGSASGGPLSARAISFLTWGHQIWHINILKERYL